MVAAATNATSHLSNVKVQLADAQNLEGMSDASFDVVTCCYGYMFPTEKETALAETLRVLKPGGTLVATTWDILYMMPLARDVMTDVLGKEPPTPDLNPMSLAEEGLFRSLVEGAGFVSVEQSTSTYPFDLGTDKYMQFRCGTEPEAEVRRARLLGPGRGGLLDHGDRRRRGRRARHARHARLTTARSV